MIRMLLFIYCPAEDSQTLDTWSWLAAWHNELAKVDTRILYTSWYESFLSFATLACALKFGPFSSPAQSFVPLLSGCIIFPHKDEITFLNKSSSHCPILVKIISLYFYWWLKSWSAVEEELTMHQLQARCNWFPPTFTI